jgi:hypothetical protein
MKDLNDIEENFRFSFELEIKKLNDRLAKFPNKKKVEKYEKEFKDKIKKLMKKKKKNVKKYLLKNKNNLFEKDEEKKKKIKTNFKPLRIKHLVLKGEGKGEEFLKKRRFRFFIWLSGIYHFSFPSWIFLLGFKFKFFFINLFRTLQRFFRFFTNGAKRLFNNTKKSLSNFFKGIATFFEKITNVFKKKKKIEKENPSNEKAESEKEIQEEKDEENKTEENEEETKK